MTSERRSTRRRIQTEKAKDGSLEDIEAGSELEIEQYHPHDEESEVDEDFTLEVADVDVDDSVEEDLQEKTGNLGGSDHATSDGSEIATPSEAGSDREIDGRKARKKAAAASSDGYHTRGLPDISNRNISRENHQEAYLGPDSPEILRFDEARRRWFGDVVLPNRTPNEYGVGGMATFPTHTNEMRQREATVGWDWYYDEGGRDAFEEWQTSDLLTKEEGLRYLPMPSQRSLTVIAGPYGQQKPHDVTLLRPVNVDELWQQCISNNKDKDSSPEPIEASDRGWLLAVASGIHSLAWAPNHGGSIQYLTIAIQRKEASGMDKTPFEPQPARRSYLQLWAFPANPLSDDNAMARIESAPSLGLVMAFDWGDIRSFEWCPMPRDFRPVTSQTSTPIGILAIIFSDGFARVFDVSIPHRQSPASSSPVYIHYNSPVFAYCPPSAVSTSLTFLSATDLAISSSNGSVAIFNIFPPSTPSPPPPSPPEPQPWFHQSLHSTYILSLTSAYPSFPNFLISSSLDGYVRLTDIRSPHMDTVTWIRQRLGPSLITYCEPILSVLTADESDTVRILPLRRFFSSMAVAKMPAGASSIAVGGVHSIAMVGCVDGSVVCLNPLRRFYGDPRTKKGGGIRWVKRVVKQEWRRVDGEKDESLIRDAQSTRVDVDGEGRGAVNGIDGAIPEPLARSRGIVRLTENYKAEKAQATSTTPRGEEGLVFTTLYEEASAAKAVAWNPNLHCGGWAAMGFGSGLVRVMDLAQSNPRV